MPYRMAWLYVCGLLLLTVPAFWPFYFSRLSEVPWQFHFHSITAGLWMLLLIWQSWSIHHGRRAAHRASGLASFVLAPVFLAAGLLIVQSMVGRSGPFEDMYANRLALFDLIAVAAFACFVFGAFRHRRNIRLHSGYMLATMFLLVNPIVARLILQWVPGLSIGSLEELPRFAVGFQIAQGLVLAAALWVFARNRRDGSPWLSVAVVIAVQSVVFETAGRADWWGAMMSGYAGLPISVLALTGLLIGAVVVAGGWRATAAKAG